MNPFRQSYEARVLVVPLSSDALDLVNTLGNLGVDGVRVLDHVDPQDARSSLLGNGGWDHPHPAGTTTITQSADMVVLVGTDLTEVAEPVVQQVCDAARESGGLIAAVLVAPSHWEEPSGASAMVTLRQEVDMLITVRGSQLLAALLDVLRGGPRKATATDQEVSA